jgi:hypothetical protein
VANTRFERHDSMPLADCFFLPSGWFWKIRFKKTTMGKFYLVDGAGLTGSSNNYMAVPNSDAAFLGKTGQEPRRLVQIYGLSPGISMVTFTAGVPGDSVTMQVEVVDLPGDRPSFVKPTAKSAALIGPGLPTQYRLDLVQTITTGPAENLFDPVPAGTKHIVVSTHGQMSAGGISMSIAGGVSQSNCTDVFAKLKGKCAGGVVWISGCDAGGDNEFCKRAATASGCYVVAPAITVPVVRVPPGMFDYFERSMIKFFKKDNGELMKAGDFLVMQNDLSFHIVSG